MCLLIMQEDYENSNLMDWLSSSSFAFHYLVILDDGQIIHALSFKLAT
jgi:hypothetical protein